MVSLADILNARILVVDDQEANVRLLEGMLRIAGYTSIESTMDPREVCELHRKNRYSLILLDLQMPVMPSTLRYFGRGAIRGSILVTPRPSVRAYSCTPNTPET